MARGRPVDPERDRRAANFANELANALAELKLTHADIARLVGVRVVSVDSWTRLSNSNLPGEANLARLCATLNQRAPGVGDRVWQAATGRSAKRIQPAASARAAAPAAVEQFDRGQALPAPVDRFIGREKEISDAAAFFSGHRGETPRRMLSMIGVGGVGKTRLALEAARAVQSLFTDGVRLVELAALADAQLVTQAVAQAVGLQQVQTSWLQALLQHLGRRHMLLVLDNCEHLIDAVSVLVERLLSECPRLHVLATSREPLHIAGEHLMRVPSLRMPTAGDSGQPDAAAAQPLPRELMRYDAIQLFVDRARQLLPDFAVDASNAADVFQVCRRLDAIPLAIELAAARLRTMSPAEILRGLDDRFDLLTGGRRYALPRQQTLRATLMWSYQLLTPVAQRLLERMCVFAGGWTRESLAVYSGGRFEQGAAQDELVEKSLVNASAQAGATRYGMHETVREFGRRMLIERGELADAQRQHARFVRDTAEQAARAFAGSQFGATARMLDQEIDNVRAALDWCQECGDDECAALGLQIVGALWMYWRLRGYLSEGRERAERFLAHAPGADAALRARALMCAGVLAFYQADYEGSGERLTTARAAYADAGNVAGAALVDTQLARIRMYSDRAWAAVKQLNEALAVFRRERDAWGEAYALVSLGEAHGRTSDVEGMRVHYAASLGSFRAIGNAWGEAAALNGMAGVALNEGHYAAARAQYEQSLALNRDLGDVGEASKVLTNIAECARGLGDWPAAIALCEEALAMRRRIGARFGMAMLTHNLGHSHMGAGNLTRAMRCFQESLTMSAGSVDDVSSITSYIAGVAGVMARRGQSPTLAAALCAVVERERAVECGPFDGADRGVFDETLRLLRQWLPEGGYDAATAAAADMTLEQAAVSAAAVSVELVDPRAT